MRLDSVTALEDASILSSLCLLSLLVTKLRVTSRAGVMAQWLTCLLHRHENLNSIPRVHVRQHSMGHTLAILALWAWSQEAAWGSLASQPRLFGELQVKVRESLQKARGRVTEKDTRD